MALTEQERRQVTTGLARFWSRRFEEVANVTMPELKAAVDAIDDWIEAEGVQINQALPLQTRTNLTMAQKTLLFCGVAAMRVSIDFARTIFGEVD